MDVSTTAIMDGYLLSMVEKQADCGGYSSLYPSARFASEPVVNKTSSLENCATKTTQNHNNKCPHFEDIVSIYHRKDGILASVCDDSSFSCACTTGYNIIGAVNEGKIGSNKSVDYKWEKLGSCEASFTDRVKWEGLAHFTGGNTQLSPRQSNIKEECTQNRSGDPCMKTYVNSDTKHSLSDLTSSLKVQSNINIMDTQHTCAHYKSQTLLDDHNCGGKTPSRSDGTNSHETITPTIKGHQNGHWGQMYTNNTQRRIYCDTTDPEKGNPQSGLTKGYFLGNAKGFVVFTLLLALTACPLTSAAPSYGDYSNTMDSKEQVERNIGENYKHSQVVGAVSISLCLSSLLSFF